MTFYLRQTTISKDISKFIITEAIIWTLSKDRELILYLSKNSYADRMF